jgi:pyruvate/2-oxoglutarate dehydrogenase complex dihydrolipoamide acyltransferase (E2) component
MRIALLLMAMATTVPATALADCAAERKRASALREVLVSVGETTVEYRSTMVKRIQEAETAATSCERAVADAKRTNEARASARKREIEAENKKEAADRFMIDEMRSQPEFLRIAWSAYECSYEKERDAVLGNPFATPEQKEGLRRAEVMLTRIRVTMKRGKLAQLSCRMDAVAKLAFCIADGSANAACVQSEMALRARAEKEIIADVQLAPNAAPLTPAEKHAKSEDEDMNLLNPQF